MNGASGASTHDVVIVGASAAGCTAATLYARQGLAVALIDRESSPDYYKKICNHFIQPFAVHTFERLGMLAALESAGAVRNGDIRVFTRWGRIHASATSRSKHQPYGYNIRRLKLDPMLRAVAAGTPGVELMLGLTARHLLADNGRFTGVAVEDKQGQARDLRARLVVGADGRNSRIAAASGVPTKVKPNNRFCYYAYYTGFSFPGQMIWFNEPDWIYAFPNDDGVTVLCSYIHKRRLPDFKSDLKKSFRRLYEGLPDGPQFDGVEQITETRGMLEIPNISRRSGHPGLALVGDAALAVDPMWGTGVSFALRSAEWLVDSTSQALLDGGAPAAVDRALEVYANTHRAKLGGHAFQIADYSTGRRLNPIEKQLFMAAVHDPVTARHFAEFEGRNISLAQFLAPTAIARAVWVNLRHGAGTGAGARRP
ncbi:MAG TPA: NAD(P)/FAD-dependent oxidoreductase [Chloroflexota bacterium]|nr:NAD(P)/FAD-dependent oxidoreductase [Chloroflexota bacterium]